MILVNLNGYHFKKYNKMGTFDYNDSVPQKEYLQHLTKLGVKNKKDNKDLQYFKDYNKFKQNAISNLNYAKDTVFITGEHTQYLNEYTHKDAKKCELYIDFMKRFNKEKITDVQLFYKYENNCEFYFNWMS